MKLEPNAPAFPTGPLGSISTPDGIISHQHDGYIGLTKREWMATVICAGMAKSWNDDQSIAQSAIELTDALIAELNKEQ